MACPLNNLNAASFDTLSSLTLHIFMGIAGSGLELDLPYGFVWKGALSRMKQLKKFELHLEYEGYFDVLLSSFGPQWGDIPEVLADPNLMPQLKEIDLGITMRVIGEGEEEEEDRRNAEAFLEQVQASVYTPWFLPLKRRKEVGELVAFSYRTEICVGETRYG